MSKHDELEKHDARQSAYRGQGKDAQEDGHGRHDPSAASADRKITANADPADGRDVGDGEPGAGPSRDEDTQPNLGQSGSYGQAGDVAEHTKKREG
jgi:hypothetical protein